MKTVFTVARDNGYSLELKSISVVKEGKDLALQGVVQAATGEGDARKYFSTTLYAKIAERSFDAIATAKRSLLARALAELTGLSVEELPAAVAPKAAVAKPAVKTEAPAPSENAIAPTVEAPKPEAAKPAPTNGNPPLHLESKAEEPAKPKQKRTRKAKVTVTKFERGNIDLLNPLLGLADEELAGWREDQALKEQFATARDAMIGEDELGEDGQVIPAFLEKFRGLLLPKPGVNASDFL